VTAVDAATHFNVGAYNQIVLLRMLVRALDVQELARIGRTRRAPIMRFACLLPDRRIQCFSLEGYDGTRIDHLEPYYYARPFTSDWRAEAQYHEPSVSVLESMDTAQQEGVLNRLARWERLLTYRGISV
jgi:hypothetical protein